MTDYHTRMFTLQTAIDRGKFGDVEIAAIFTGKIERPWYVALRNRSTSDIQLVALDGNFTETTTADRSRYIATD